MPDDNGSNASVDVSKKRSFKETLRIAVSPADKERLQKLDTKCKLLKHSIKTFVDKKKKATYEELHKAEAKYYDIRRRVEKMENSVREKKTLLENVKREKSELYEKMNSDIDMAAGPPGPPEGGQGAD